MCLCNSSQHEFVPNSIPWTENILSLVIPQGITDTVGKENVGDWQMARGKKQKGKKVQHKIMVMLGSKQLMISGLTLGVVENLQNLILMNNLSMISWNVRGLNSPLKKNELKKVICSNNSSLGAALETRIKPDNWLEFKRWWKTYWTLEMTSNISCSMNSKIRSSGIRIRLT